MRGGASYVHVLVTESFQLLLTASVVSCEDGLAVSQPLTAAQLGDPLWSASVVGRGVSSHLG